MMYDHRHRIAIVLILIGLISACAWGASESAAFTVKYRSIDRVYLDAGKEQGLYPGTVLGLYAADSLIAKLEVVYASGSSASCQILLGDQHLDRDVVLEVVSWGSDPTAAANQSESADSISNKSVNIATEPKRREEDHVSGQLDGSVSLQWYNWQDRTGAGLDFSQATMRLNLRARQINGGDWSLRVRSRGQYDQRSRDYSTGAPSDEFVNRIYEASATYGNEDSRWQVQFGRILPRRLTRVGYLDGATADLRLGDSWHTGILAGAKPRWQFQEKQMSLQKYGSYLGFEIDRDQLRAEQYLALVGEYHGGTISRELLHLHGNLRQGSKWGLYHQLEFDINRGWRQEKSGRSVALSSIYLNARHRFSRRVALSVSYDSRQNYWTYEQQTVADSLFDDELRRGLRTRLSLRLPARIVLNSELGYRKGSDESEATKSYSLYLSKSSLVLRGLNLSARLSAFTGPNSSGNTYTLRLNHQLNNRVMLGAGYGAYMYKTNLQAVQRRNDWWEGEVRIELPLRTFVYGRYQAQSGDDIVGNTLDLEIGKRF